MTDTNRSVVLRLRGTCPISVGHRVEVQIFFTSGGAGPFGLGRPVPDLAHPLVTDLETGVRYGVFAHFHAPLTTWTQRPFALAPQPLPELSEHSRWSGKVVGCNVVMTRWDKDEFQTTLVIERDESA